MDKPIHISRLPKFIIRQINKYKIKSVQDLLDRDDNLNLKYINLTTALEATIPTKTALEIEAKESQLNNTNLQHILTPGKIIEVASLPKINKTAFCMNLVSSLLQQYPEKHVFYVTHSDFPKDKLYVKRFFPNEEVLDKVHISRFETYQELTQFVIYLKDFIAKTATISICIIDPLAPFLKSLGFNTRISAYKLLRDLKQLGFYNNFSILITNNFTTAIHKGEVKVIPALNSTLSHRVDARFVIENFENSIWILSTLKL